MPQTIFRKVIKSENQISQLLVNLVNENESIRTVVTKFLFPNENECSIKSFETQKRNENGQPDIRFDIYNKSSELIGHAIIEVKTKDSKPTDNQPKGYVSELLDEKYKKIKKYLFFLVPRYYNYETKIIDDYKMIKGTEAIIFDCQKYWDVLAKELLTLKTTDDIIACEKKLLLNTIIEHFEEIFLFKEINFESNEIEIMKEDVVPKIILKLNEVIEQVAKSYSFKKIPKEQSEDDDYFGRWYQDNLIWFGYDYKIWKKHKTPLILQVHRKTNSAAFEKFDSIFNDRFKIFEDGNDVKFINIPLEEKPVEKICELIKEFSDKLSE